METPKQNSELEVHFKPESGKAVIEGKTVVPFQSFVTLILQRKVIGLFKSWGKHPVIVESELLTSLASAPQDSHENRNHLILVSVGLGTIIGVALLALVQFLLLFLEISLGYRELGIIAGGIFGVAIFVLLLMKMQKMPRGEKLTETIEDLSSFLSK